MSTPGWVGFADASSHSVVSYSGTWDAFPGIAVLGDGRLICTYNTGANQTETTHLVYRLSSNTGATWGAQQTLYTPSAGNFSAGTEVAVMADGTVVVSTVDQVTATGVGTVYIFTGAVAGQSGGTNNDGITWGARITACSGSPFGGSGVYSGASKVLERSAGSWMLPVYGGPSTSGTGAVFSTNSGSTWSGVTQIIAPDGTHANEYNEAAYIKVPAGFANAGRLIGIVRQDLPNNAGGYLRVYCDGDPTAGANWSSPSLVLAVSNANGSVGRPSLLAIQQGGSLGLVLLARFNADPRTGYTVSWDQGLTWTSLQQFGEATAQSRQPLVQHWYGSLADLGSGNLAAVVSQAFTGNNTVAWVEYREMTVLAAQ